MRALLQNTKKSVKTVFSNFQAVRKAFKAPSFEAAVSIIDTQYK